MDEAGVARLHEVTRTRDGATPSKSSGEVVGRGINNPSALRGGKAERGDLLGTGKGTTEKPKEAWERDTARNQVEGPKKVRRD